MIRIGLVGYGYWGPNLARNATIPGLSELGAICDIASNRLLEAHRKHPEVAVTNDPKALISDPRIDAVAIATPVESHFDLALAVLRAGKHVLIEKPCTQSSEQSLRLIEESDRRGLTLMVDHTYLFSPAVDAIAAILRGEELGRLLSWDSARLDLGQVRRDVNVAWDLASHDLSIYDYVLPSPPCALSATGVALHPGRLEQIAHISLYFPGGLLVHIHVSWLSPVKVRRSAIVGSRRTLIWDDQEPTDKVRLHDSGVDWSQGDDEVYYRRGDVRSIPTHAEEPLNRAVRHFACCISDRRRPISDGMAGLRVVQQLEAIERSLKFRGQVMSLDSAGATALPVGESSETASAAVTGD